MVRLKYYAKCYFEHHYISSAKLMLLNAESITERKPLAKGYNLIPLEENDCRIKMFNTEPEIKLFKCPNHFQSTQIL